MKFIYFNEGIWVLCQTVLILTFQGIYLFLISTAKFIHGTESTANEKLILKQDYIKKNQGVKSRRAFTLPLRKMIICILGSQ